MTTTIAAIIVIGLGSWYFDHHKRRTREADNLAIHVGIKRLPGESNAALLERVRARREGSPWLS